MIVVQHILPTIRVAISKKLVEEKGLKKSKVSQLMGVTPAAITQYLNKKRGNDLELINQSPRINELISELAEDIFSEIDQPDILLLQLCRICQVVRSEGIICKLHIEAMPSLNNSQPCSCSLGLINTE